MDKELILFLKSQLKPRDPHANKGNFGTLTVIAGCSLYRGAPSLAASAAYRSGVGIVRIASTERVISSVSSKLSEAIYLPIEEGEGGVISSSDLSDKLASFSKSSAVLIGCGMSDCYDTERSVRNVIYGVDSRIVLDADALNSIRHCPEVLSDAKQMPIITPHLKEMSRLCGMSVDKIKAKRIDVACDFASKYNTVVVLKDFCTVIASPEGVHFMLDRANSGLAKGGSGDVLSGIIASLLAQGYIPTDAAMCGVALHALAGAVAEERLGAHSMLPSDIVSSLPEAFKLVYDAEPEN